MIACAKPTHKRPLIFDRSYDGHRARGLQTWSAALNGESYVGHDNVARRTVVSWPGPVLLQTADEYSGLAAQIAIERGLGGYRTAATTQRPAHLSLTTRALLRRGGFEVGTSVIPGFTLISIAPRIRNGAIHNTSPWIYDSEWWDIGVCAEDPAIPPPSGRAAFTPEGPPVVLFCGGITLLKGFAFFTSLAQRAGGRFRFIAAGRNVDVPDEMLRDFIAAGGVLIERRLTDEQLFASIASASLVWCCYRPDFDQSSGIFGRAIQLGSRPLVRQGSWLAHAAKLMGVGAQLPYNAADDAILLATEAASITVSGRVDITALRHHSINVVARHLECAAPQVRNEADAL